MSYLVRHPDAILRGEIQIQPSKSMANRLLILDHLHGGGSSFIDIPHADDSRFLKQALEALRNYSGHSPITIDVKDGGTTSRFLLSVLAFTPGNFILTGSKRLSERPIALLIEKLRSLGANIEGNKLPLTISGSDPELQDEIRLEIDTSTSSQFASSVLMVIPKLCSKAEILLTGDHLSLPYLDLTIGMMKRFGFKIERDGQLIRFNGSEKKTSPDAYNLEPDYSSIAFWVGITALSKAAEIRINATNFRDSLQGDSIVIDRAVANGVINIKDEGDHLILRSPDRQADKRNLLIDYTDCPDLALPELVMYSVLGFGIRLTGTKTLQLKESARLDSLNEGLRPFGLQAIRSVDGHRMEGDFTLPDSIPSIETFNDHRVAMAFSMLALKAPLLIEDPSVVSKSYPSFWDDLRKLNFEVTQNP